MYIYFAAYLLSLYSTFGVCFVGLVFHFCIFVLFVCFMCVTVPTNKNLWRWTVMLKYLLNWIIYYYYYYYYYCCLCCFCCATLVNVLLIFSIIIIVSFMHGSHTHIPGTNHVPRGYTVAAILSLLFMVPLYLVPALALLFFYVSTFRSMCAVPNMAVFCSSLIWTKRRR